MPSPLRAIAGPDRIAPNQMTVGFDGSRSTSPTQPIGYKWQMIQVPEGDPHLLHYTDALLVYGIARISGDPVIPVNITIASGSNEVFVTSAGAPVDLVALGVVLGDILDITAGPNTGRYVLTSDPYGPFFNYVGLDQIMITSEVTADFSIYPGTTTQIKLVFPAWEVLVGDILVVDGRGVELTLVTPGAPGILEFADDPLPAPGLTVPYVQVIQAVILMNSGTPYPMFVPSVQGIYAVRLFVFDAFGARSEPDLAVVSVLPSNTATGLPVDASWMWQSLGDFWNLVSDKTWMETAWRSFIRVAGALLQQIWNVQASFSLGASQDVIMDRWVGVNPALPEPAPEKGSFHRRFAPLFSAELPPGIVTVQYLIGDVPDGTTIEVTADTSVLADAINEKLETEGIDGITARIELVKTTRHLVIRSESYVVEGLLGVLYGPTSRSTLFAGIGSRVPGAPRTFWLTDPVVLPEASNYYVAQYDADRTLHKGDIIVIGGTNFTVESSGHTTDGISYPFSYVVVTEDIPDGPTASPIATPFVIPSYYHSAEVDFLYELVVPGDRAIFEVDADGVRTEGQVEVAGAGFYRLGLMDPAIFFSGRDLALKHVLRRFYVPVEDIDLSIPVLKEHSEATLGWREYEHYVLAQRWGRRAVVFDFTSELPDTHYMTARDLTLGPAGVPTPTDTMWAEIVYRDNRPYLSGVYGERLGLPLSEAPQRSGFSYQRALLGLWFVYLKGSKPREIERGLSIICGAPFFEAAGTIRDSRILNASKGYLLVEDLKNPEIVRGYIYPLSIGLDINPATGGTYKVGDTVEWFETVSNAAIYRDYISHPDFVAGLIAAGVIVEPEKYHRFWAAVDVDILDPRDVEAITAARDFLLAFRTTYNYPFFALLKRLETSLDIRDTVMMKITLHLLMHPKARWGCTFDRYQLSGRMVPWTGMSAPPSPLPSDTGVHNYFDVVLDGREHYAAVRVDVNPGVDPQRFEIWHVAPGGVLQNRVNLVSAGVLVGHLYVDQAGVEELISAMDPAGAWFEIAPAAFKDPTFIFSIMAVDPAVSTLRTWWGFDNVLFYLRDHVRIIVRQSAGGLVIHDEIEPAGTGYVGPEPSDEVP